VARGPRKKLLAFGGITDQVTLGLVLELQLAPVWSIAGLKIVCSYALFVQLKLENVQSKRNICAVNFCYTFHKTIAITYA